MAKELSIEEAFGTAPTSTATSEPKELSIAEAFGAVPAEKPKKITTIKQDNDNGFITDALDFIKQVAGPVVGAIPTIPRGIEQGIRGGLRASAEGQPSSIMPSSVYNPTLDTEEALFGTETEKQTAQRKLNAQRVLARIPDIPGLKAAADIGHRATENIQKSISPEAKKAIKESTPEGNLFKGELSFGKNPSLYGYALQGANVFGSLLPVIVGTMVTKDPNTGAVIGAGMAADEASSNAADTINKLSNQQLAEQSPFYAQMLHGGASPKEARDLTIRKAAETGAALQGVVAGFGDKLVGHLISGSFDKMIEKLTGKSILAKTAATGAISSLEEGTTETGEGVASNVGLQSVLPNTELGEGSAANFALGALGGAGPGVVKGALSGIQDRLNGEEEEVPTKEPYIPAQFQTSAANTYQMPARQQPIVPTVLQKEQQLKQTINPSIPNAASAQGTLSPYHPAFGGQVDPETGEILQKEQQLKQTVENPVLYTRPDEYQSSIQKLQTSISNAPIARNIDPETGEITPVKVTLPEQKQSGFRIDPETGEILDMPTATNVPNTSAPAIEQQEKIQTETARLVAAGFPLDAAKVMAEKTVTRETNKKEESPKVATSPNTQVADEIVNAKIEERAIAIAYNTDVPYKEAYKQAYKEIKGEPNATGPDTQSTGTSVQTPGQPTAVQRTTSGAQGTERNGVVSGNQNAPSNNVGKGKQPAPIVFKEDLETPELTDEEITQRLKDQALKEEEQNKPEEFEEEQTTPTTTVAKEKRPISNYEASIRVAIGKRGEYSLQKKNGKPASDLTFKTEEEARAAAAKLYPRSTVASDIFSHDSNFFISKDEAIAKADYENKKAEAITAGASAAESAFADQKHYDSLKQSIDSHDENLSETIRGWGLQDHPFYGDIAQAAGIAFDTEVERLTKKNYENKKAEVEQIARANADGAFDNFHDYDSLQQSIDSYQQNILDTLVEKGLEKDPDFDKLVNAALKAFDAEVEKLKGKQEQTTPTTTTTTTTTPIVTKKRGRPISENKVDNTATKAQNKKADAALLKIEKQLDKANEPIDLDELVDDKDLKGKEELKRVAKKEAVKELLDLSEHPDNQRGSATDKRIQALLNDRKRIPANMLADIKKGREILKNRTSQMSAKANIGKPQARFSGATNAAQALTIISRVGNVFERFIAGRLQRFVQNVKFVVLEDGDPLPEQLQKPRNKEAWDGARGLFIYDPKTKERTVYVRGISFGEDQGVNVITVLHEIIHAATNSRIEAGLLANYLGGHGNSNLRTLIKDLNSLMVNAADRYEQLKAAGKLPEGLQRLVESTLDEEGDYKIFTLPHEFLAYGMSSPELQAMLKGMEGKRKAGFSGFVQMIMEALGVGKADVNAFTDLIDITDKSLKAKLTKAMKVAIGEQENFEPLQATKLKAVVSKGEKAVADSQVGRELSTNLSALQMLRNPSYIWDSVQASWAGLSEGARKFISHAYDSEALAYGGPGTVITELQNTHKLLQRMSGMSQNILTNAGKQANNIVDFFREFPDKRKTFEDLINGTTIDQYDPSKPQAKKNLTYDTWYASLGQKGQDVYNGLKQYYSDMRDYQQHLLEEQIKNLKLPPAEEQKLLKALQDKFDADKIIEPYFPLMRYGDYVLEFGKGKNRVVLRYETLGERDLAARRQARKLRKSFSQAKTDGDIKISNDIGSTKLRGTIEGTSQLLKSVYEAIDTANLQNPGAAAALKDNVYQAYLSAMPEQSIRKLFMHRTGVAGFSPDIIKNVNNMGIRMSNQFAKLKYGAPLRNSLETARGQLEGREEYTPFVARMAEFVGEAISPTPKSDLASYGDIIAGGLTKLSFLHYMTSWSSAMLQPLDIFLKGVPVLTGSHGPRAIVEISKMAKLWDTFGITEKQANGTTVFHAPSIEFAKGLTPMQRRAVQELRNFDVTRNTLTNEVFRQAQTPVSKVDSKGVAIAKLAGRTLILGGLMHHGERISREVIYLASYNLTREEGLKAGVQPGENYPDMLERVHNEAVDKAVQETNETFGNYSAYNRPMIMRGALGKIVTQYKFFPLVTTKLLVGNFFKMMPLMNKEGKVEAATKFFGIMGTHLLFGGLVALPLFSTVMGMLGAAWRRWGKDDDAPDDMKSIDFETWFRTIHLPELFGDTKLGDLSELVERGLLNKLTGWDISSHISLNDFWFRDPAPGKDLKASVQNWGMTLGGAGVNYALSFAKGLQSIGNGDYEQGIEAIAPGSISSLLAAHRESQEGIKNSQGHTLVEKGKVGPGVIAGQAVGFKSDIAQSRQNAIFKADAADRQIYQERQGLTDKLKEYKQKSLDEDKGQTYQDRFEDKYQQVLDRIQDFNTRNPEKEITTDEMVKTLVDARKKFGAAESNQGIPLTLKNARLLSPIRDTLESREPK